MGSGEKQARLKASPWVICRDQASAPVSTSKAKKASEVPVGGSE